MSKLRFAIIGCGRIAPNHVAAYLNNQAELELVGVCDLIPEKMDELLDSAKIPEGEKEKIHKYLDYRELLQAEKPQLVAITTDSGSHAQIALDCIEAGSNLIIEKPIAMSLIDADEIIKQAKDRGVTVCACHQNRFNKSIQKIRAALEEGKFGRLLHGTAHIRWNRGKDYYTQATWRGTWEKDGGALMNQCLHNIDLLRWMMGDEIEEVFAYTDRLAHPYIEAEDLGLALIKFKNGSYGAIEGTTNVYPSNLEETLYIFGETGTVKAGGKSVNIIEEWRFADDTENAEEVKARFAENPPNVYGFGHTPLYKDVIESIKKGCAPYIDAEAGRRALELVLAIYKSAKEGRPIKLPLADFSTSEMIGNFKD